MIHCVVGKEKKKTKRASELCISFSTAVMYDAPPLIRRVWGRTKEKEEEEETETIVIVFF